MSILWLMALSIILVGLQALLFGVNNLRRFSYSRRFSVSNAFEGEKVELIETIRNEKLLPVPWLRAESRIPIELQFAREQLSPSHEVSGGMYHRSMFFLPPMCLINRHHEVTLSRRGIYEAGSVALATGDLFSLARKKRQMNFDCSILVYPRLLSEDELPEPAMRFLGDAIVKRWIMPDPFLVNGIRDYAPGDPLRDVHWKASARTGQLRVKLRDYTTDPKVLVLLNIQSTQNQWSDVPVQFVDMMERAISVCATLCLRALRYGMSAGFGSNACLNGTHGSGKGIYVPGMGGSAQADKLLETMAKTELHMELSMHTFLESLEDVNGEDILILTAYEDEDLLSAVQKLRNRGNTVTLSAIRQ
ncbi:MAG: DUF58 domain-containing protein [Clostridia bacterium]|nr:DUF58 domain-containing protein [Clostridia bacterium]